MTVEEALKARELIGQEVVISTPSGPQRGTLIGTNPVIVEEGPRRWMLSRAVIRAVRRA